MKYKFDRYPLFLGMFAMTALLPAMSLFEFVTTGTIDMDAVGRGRGKIPSWILYSLSWVCFAFVSVTAFAPALMCILKGVIFEIRDGKLILDGKAIRPEMIQSFGQAGMRGTKIETTIGTFYCHPGLNTEGKAALDQFLEATQFA